MIRSAASKIAYLAVIGVTAAVYVFLVRPARNQRFLDRFLEMGPAR